MNMFRLLLLMFLMLCGSPLNAVTIELWHPRPESVNFWPQFTQKVHQLYPDIELKISYLPTEELKQAIIRSAYQGQSPEIILAPSDFIGNYKRMRLSAIPTSLINSNQHPQFIKTTELNNKNYGVPIVGGNHLIIYYNKKLVQNPATSWQEFYTQKQDLESKGVSTLAMKYNEMYWFTSFITAFGGFPVDGNRITLNTEAVRDALVFYRNLSQQKLVPADCDYSCVTDRFYDNEFAYSMNGTWAYKQTAEKLGEHLGVITIPKLNDREIRPMFSSLALMYPNQSLQGEKRKAIEEITSLLQSQQQQILLHEITGMMPTHTQIMQLIKSRADDNRQAMLAQLNNAKAMPPCQAMAAAWTGMAKGYKLFMDDKVDAEQAAALMQKIAQRELEKMQMEE